MAEAHTPRAGDGAGAHGAGPLSWSGSAEGTARQYPTGSWSHLCPVAEAQPVEEALGAAKTAERRQAAREEPVGGGDRHQGCNQMLRSREGTVRTAPTHSSAAPRASPQPAARSRRPGTHTLRAPKVRALPLWTLCPWLPGARDLLTLSPPPHRESGDSAGWDAAGFAPSGGLRDPGSGASRLLLLVSLRGRSGTVPSEG